MIVANNQQEEKEDFPTKKAYSIEVRKHWSLYFFPKKNE